MHFSFLDVFSSLLVNQIRTSEKLKEIIQRILYLENIMNQGTARGKLLCYSYSTSYCELDSRVGPLFHCIIYLFLSERKSIVVDSAFYRRCSSIQVGQFVKIKRYTCC